MSTIPQRFLWAVELLNIQPLHQILEIGCGTGVLAEQICKKIKGGKYTGIDKSASMRDKAVARNQDAIKSGTALFLNIVVEEAVLKSSFDSVVAFNVPLFQTGSQPAFKNVRKCLKKEGKLFIFYQAPYQITLQHAEPIKDLLVQNGFEILHTNIKKFEPTPALVVVAKP